MKREEKAAVVEELASRLSEAQAIFAVDYRGISVTQAAELRAKLREADATFKGGKNRLAKRSAEQAGVEGLDEYLRGPIALTLVKGDAVTAAKTITEFSKEHELLEYRGGLMDGSPLDPDGFKQIARLPGVDVLRGRLVGITASPLTGLVTSLNNLVAGLGRQLSQIAEQGLVGGEGKAEEEAKAEEPAAEAEAEEAKAEESAGEAKAEEEQPEGEAEEAKSEGEGEAEAEGEGEAEAKAEAEQQPEAEEETSEAPQASEQDDESEGSADGSAQEGEDAEGSDETAQED